MNWPLRSDRWGLGTRIVALSLLLLLLVQAAGFGVVRASIGRNARNQITHELSVSERVWLRLLEQNAQKLRQGAALLAADFGFRSAVSSGDVDTIRSALDNHGARIGAAVTALLDTGLQLRALSETPGATTLAPALRQIAQSLARDPQGSQIALVGHVPYQFVMVPMRAPVVIGWVVMGFPVDQALVNDMRALSEVHLALLSRSGDAPVRIVVSTLPPESLQALLAAGGAIDELRLDGDTLVARSVRLPTATGEVHTVMLRSLDEVTAPFLQVQLVLAIITGLGVLLFGIGSSFTARWVTTPLRSLVAATERLGRGEYDTPMQHTRRHDEIGGLAKAFDRMRVNIAAHQAEIRRLAYWDRLTGLPNRVRFREAVLHAMASRNPQEGGLAIVMLDLDRFKHVNDVLGYAFGDRLLKAVAERLSQQTTGSGDLVARLGGDEFAVLLAHSDAQGALDAAQRMAASFETPLTLEDQTVDLSAGIGVACWPAHATDVDALLSRAEVAMYAAKRKTTGAQLYDPALDSTSSQTLSLLTELRHAVEHGELRLYLQPKIALASSRVVGAEALVRWQHPQRGLLAPMQFIPFAEQTGFVRQLTLWMMDEAARQSPGLQLAGQPLRISVNLSTRDLLDQDLPAKLDTVLARHQVPATAFCLEITESAIMDDPQRAEATLNRLSERGFKLSIDDFGTGYSSLAYLKRLPVDELKIDKSFVMGMESDADDAKIVRSTIDLAHNLGLSVVAEGVETAATQDQLRELACDEAQGYHMSKPLPVAEFIAWRARWAQQASDDLQLIH
ncbi:MAG TPA: EAL domain-containing protein [Burkholderiaceae bacterium]|nr:EAL domain-containing protein [Burkholderiaceae bacterium]